MSLSGSKPCFKSAILSGVLIVAAGLLLVGTPPLAMGQASTGTVTGQVSDAQGAVIPAATIKLTDPTTNAVREITTNDVGRFTIPNIPPGDYVVTVTKEGFTAARLSGQHVEVGETLTLNVPLAVGAATTTVEVQAAAGAELQTLNATIGTTMRNDALTVMPNLARDVGARSRACRWACRWPATWPARRRIRTRCNWTAATIATTWRAAATATFPATATPDSNT